MVEKTTKHTEYYDYSYSQMKNGLKKLIRRIKISTRKYDSIYCIPRGGYIPAVILSHILDLPIVQQLKVGTSLVVDDILDTGKTLSEFKYNDKVVLVAKPKGRIEQPHAFFDIEVPDNCWVTFWWEEWL